MKTIASKKDFRGLVQEIGGDTPIRKAILHDNRLVFTNETSTIKFGTLHLFKESSLDTTTELTRLQSKKLEHIINKVEFSNVLDGLTYTVNYIDSRGAN